jgi:hypothetical protein
MAKDQSVPDVMNIVGMSIALNALAGMVWYEPKQNDINTMTFRAGPANIQYEVERRLSGWTAKLSIRANRILIYEAHVIPRRGQADTDLINAWDKVSTKMFDAKEGVVDSTRELAYTDLEDWVRDN